MEIDPNAYYRVWYLFSDHAEYMYGHALIKKREDEFYQRMIAGWENTNED